MQDEPFSEATSQADSRATVSRHARDYLENAISTLGGLMNDPKAQSAQVRACENIIAWGAGKPGRYVDIGSLKGMTVYDAVDHVISAVASGQCSLEDGEALIDMLKKRIDLTEVERMRRELDDLKKQRIANVQS
ncbi:hypothetical protein [Rhizobium laguerreae]|uniref:hypothetical protein n=1 Tax=Rhizobium laguerreae TaxID=1076926 RepID=UPI001C91D455|nr:hypothetical protein [Rhizobium laguerreae]MBY3194239.1 hypothetical protein [Rhizobium laguerreae]